MLNESLEGLNIKENGIYCDLTLGRAGHSKEILKRLNSGMLFAIDQDEEAIKYSSKILNDTGRNFEIIKSNFRNIKEVLNERGITKIDGAIFDLGVSSPQLDEDYRGFSYRYDAILDMRMDLSNKLTAKEIVNSYSFKELVKVFKEYGEEKFAIPIAKNIIKAREKKEIESTIELVEIIKASKPMKELKKVGHPAKQVFQALRIEVNDELNSLRIGLEDVINLLNIGGRVVVISFQSLEDRIVKKLFRKYSVIEGNRINEAINPEDIKAPDYIEISKKVIVADKKELEENHRSKSAKLRILERIK